MGDGKGQHVDNCRGIEKGTRSRDYGRGQKADMGWEPLFLALSLPFCLVWLESSHFLSASSRSWLFGGRDNQKENLVFPPSTCTLSHLSMLLDPMHGLVNSLLFLLFFFFQYPIHFLRASISSSFPLLSSPSFSFTLSRLTLRPRPPPFPSCSP